MLPPDHVGLLVADTRRAAQWEAGLRAAGLAAMRVETSGADIAKGDWQIAVPRAQATVARAYVRDVMQGEKRLPSGVALPRWAWRAMLGIAAIIALIVALSLCGR